ncbi:pyridoxamine 5'-phosphate oxidase family protein [Weissella confusa]|uniref:pyridoxamine 5'-phosphate oxidase family protein n=1 Tax=Weissella confusa TaxID=1583 RepID=UPI0022E40C29|nr:pyridoxamine 5'-phosphate oxidase family protein [Weissella confusa]
MTPYDEQLVAHMKLREHHMKRRQVTTNKIFRLQKRVKQVTTLIGTLVSTIILMAILIYSPLDVRERLQGLPRVDVLIFVGLLIIMSFIMHKMIECGTMKRFFKRQSAKIRRRYSGELHAGRRWIQFYYKGRDIGPLIPQILYYVDSEGEFDSVDTAINHIDQTVGRLQKAGVEKFQRYARLTNQVILSSIRSDGKPSSRLMRFVKVPDRPNVWLMASAPDTPKIAELTNNRVAIFTPPTRDGATISSNNVSIVQAPYHLEAVTDLFKEQVHGYLDGMNEEDLATEIVFELTIHSAKLDTWTDHSLAVLDEKGYL